MDGTPAGRRDTGRFDESEVAAVAREREPGMPEEEAQRLARAAWGHLQRLGELDEAAVARALLQHELDGGAASAATVVARAAVDHCRRHGLHPGG